MLIAACACTCALPGVGIVAALVALTARVWLLCGDRQVHGGAGRGQLQQLSCVEDIMAKHVETSRLRLLPKNSQ